MARGNNMGRGPYEKSSIVEDTGLPPGKEVEARFDIFYPVMDGPDGRQIAEEREMDVTVELWYKPFGTMDSAVLWREWDATISLDKKSKPTTYSSGNPK